MEVIADRHGSHDFSSTRILERDSSRYLPLIDIFFVQQDSKEPDCTLTLVFTTIADLSSNFLFLLLLETRDYMSPASF